MGNSILTLANNKLQDENTINYLKLIVQYEKAKKDRTVPGFLSGLHYSATKKDNFDNLDALFRLAVCHKVQKVANAEEDLQEFYALEHYKPKETQKPKQRSIFEESITNDKI